MQDSEKQLIDEAIDNFLDAVQVEDATDAEFNPKTLAKDGIIYADETVPSGIRLRLDFELDGTEHSEEVAKAALGEFAKLDLYDLVENGDSSNSTDPLYNLIDGSKKRGVPLKSLKIRSVYLFKEYRWVKNTVEYTLYFNLLPEW